MAFFLGHFQGLVWATFGALSGAVLGLSCCYLTNSLRCVFAASLFAFCFLLSFSAFWPFSCFLLFVLAFFPLVISVNYPIAYLRLN